MVTLLKTQKMPGFSHQRLLSRRGSLLALVMLGVSSIHAAGQLPPHIISSSASGSGSSFSHSQAAASSSGQQVLIDPAIARAIDQACSQITVGDNVAPLINFLRQDREVQQAIRSNPENCMNYIVIRLCSTVAAGVPEMAVPMLKEGMNYTCQILHAKSNHYAGCEEPIRFIDASLRNPLAFTLVQILEIEDAFPEAAAQFAADPLPTRATGAVGRHSSLISASSSSSAAAAAAAPNISSAIAASSSSVPSGASFAAAQPALDADDDSDDDAASAPPAGGRAPRTSRQQVAEIMAAVENFVQAPADALAAIDACTDDRQLVLTFLQQASNVQVVQIGSLFKQFLSRYFLGLHPDRLGNNPLGAISDILNVVEELIVTMPDGDQKTEILNYIAMAKSVPNYFAIAGKWASVVGWIFQSNPQYRDALTSFVHASGLVHAINASIEQMPPGMIRIPANGTGVAGAAAAASSASSVPLAYPGAPGLIGTAPAAPSTGHWGNVGSIGTLITSFQGAIPATPAFCINDGPLVSFTPDNYLTLAYMGDKTKIEYFISRYRQNIDVKNSYGHSALMNAAFGYVAGNDAAAEVFTYLLAQGADSKVMLIENGVQVRTFEQHVVNQASWTGNDKARYEHIRGLLQAHHDISALRPEAVPVKAVQRPASRWRFITKQRVGWTLFGFSALGLGYLYWRSVQRARNAGSGTNAASNTAVQAPAATNP